MSVATLYDKSLPEWTIHGQPTFSTDPHLQVWRIDDLIHCDKAQAELSAHRCAALLAQKCSRCEAFLVWLS